MTPIAFIDDYPSFRDYLTAHLEGLPHGFKVHSYNHGQDFVSRFPTENYTPAIVLMDIKMPYMNGYDTTAWIKKEYPSIPVLAFSDINCAEAIVQLVKSGANGHCSKADCYPPVRLLEAMSEVMQGKEYYDDQELYLFVKKRLAMPRKQLEEGLESLTERELSVIRYIRLHKTYQESAAELCISTDAYKSRLKSIFKKLGVKSSKELYDWTVEKGFRDK